MWVESYTNSLSITVRIVCSVLLFFCRKSEASIRLGGEKLYSLLGKMTRRWKPWKPVWQPDERSPFVPLIQSIHTIECDPSNNNSSNSCACTRKTNGETLMFPDVFHVQSTSFWVLQLRWFAWAIGRGLIRETENPKAWDGVSDQCA